ncbi:single-stranded DNA-binding protein [Halobacteriales archaeon SW_6_65_15]|nr:MAG: single-stranded DNA-binding protein [Halobacteriales archaeon SW_6_65_15]
MDIEAYERHDRIERVEAAEASENDLLTVAIPPDRSLGEVLEQVEEDRAEAEYIDAEGEDAAYLQALERVRRVLQRQGGTPEQGLVVYAGVVDGEVVEYVFDDLPTPVSEFVYERDNEFDVGPLEAAEGAAKTFGLLVVERGGAALGLAENEDVRVVETFDSDVMGKTKAGGQSADRFERDRERQKEEFFEEVAEEAKRAFLHEADGDADESDEIDGLLLGGTTVTVEDFREGDHLDHRLRDRLVGDSVAVEYASEQGLHQLVEKASDRIRDEERRETRETLDRFFEALHEGGGTDEDDGESVVYGREEVERALDYDAVKTLLVSEALPVEDVRDLREEVSNEGGDCRVVSTDFGRGKQFSEAFGGVAAILRFPIE